MMDLISKKCKETECNKRPLFGFSKTEYCNEHKKDMMKSLWKKCKEENCKNYCGQGRLILEIQGGSAKELEIKKGDEVKLLL